MLIAILAGSIGLAIASPAPHWTSTRSLTFEQRVDAQAAIERVYYAHQIDATTPFEQAVPRSVVEGKVRNYLEQSAALSVYWKTEVTDELLQRELERMAQDTKMPDRLLELYAALGDDAFLVKECLARATLVDRMTRRFYASDAALQFVPENWDDWWPTARQTLNAEAVPIVATDEGALPTAATISGATTATCPGNDAWTPTSVSGASPIARRGHSAVWTGSRMLVWGGRDSTLADLDSGGVYDPVTDTWSSTTTSDAPAARINHSAVWTGSLMVVWGGITGSTYTSTGGRYDPATDSWTPTATAGAPTARSQHAVVWTGSQMIVWGGQFGSTKLNTGGRYNPTTDSWTPTATIDAPSARDAHVAVWTGTLVVVWGGRAVSGDVSSGARYDPSSDSWTSTAATSVAVRNSPSAVWTGARMVIWGGIVGGVPTNTGGMYDPVADNWAATSTGGNTPSARILNSAVWTGRHMLIWGGVNGTTYLGDGRRFDPNANAWLSMSTSTAPGARSMHSTVWTGSEMIPWGGYNGSFLDSGGRYGVDVDGDGYTACQGDCNENNDLVHPGALEVCNGLDDDCNGQLDENAQGEDTDSDGVHNACDNCVSRPNGTQSDSNLDGEGDACDLDDGLIYVYDADRSNRQWQAESGYTGWNSYRGSLAVLRATGEYTQAPGSNSLAARDCGLATLSVLDPVVPNPGETSFHLVTGVHAGVEGSLGMDSAGVPRANTNPCP